MSNTKLAFAGDVQKFMSMFPSFAAFAEEIGKIGSLEQAAKEAEARLERAQHENHGLDDQRQQILSDAHSKADDVRHQAELDAAAARGQIAEDVMAARREAEKIKTDAVASIQTFQAEATANLARTTGAVETARLALQEHNERLNAAKDEYAGLLADIRKSKARLEEINVELAAFRKRLSA